MLPNEPNIPLRSLADIDSPIEVFETTVSRSGELTWQVRGLYGARDVISGRCTPVISVGFEACKPEKATELSQRAL
jgi:hypothetical protein